MNHLDLISNRVYSSCGLKIGFSQINWNVLDLDIRIAMKRVRLLAETDIMEIMWPVSSFRDLKQLPIILKCLSSKRSNLSKY